MVATSILGGAKAFVQLVVKSVEKGGGPDVVQLGLGVRFRGPRTTGVGTPGSIGQRGDHAAGGPQDVQHHAGGPRQVGLRQCLEICGGGGGLQAHGRGLYGRQAARGDSYS